MKTITALIQGAHDPNMVNIYLDGEYYTNVPIDFIVEYNLKKGKELSDSDIALLEHDKLKSKAYMFVLNSVTKRSVSVHDMKEKLYNKQYPSSIINEVIDRALSYNYLDDDYYAKIFVEQNIKTKGSLRIRADLKRHGISDALIAKYLVDTDEEYASALRECSKYAERLDLEDPKDKNKLIRHMQYKGYKWDIVSSVVAKVVDGYDD